MGSGTPAPEAPRRPWWRPSRRALLAALAGTAGVVLVARAALPMVLRGVLESRASEALGVEVIARDVDLSLLRGMARLEGVSVASPLGEERGPVLAIDTLEANVGWLGLLRREAVVDSVVLRGARVRSHRDGERRADLAALLRAIEEKPGEPAKDEGKDDEPKKDQAEERGDDKAEAPERDGEPASRDRAVIVRSLVVEDSEGTFSAETPPRYAGEASARVGRIEATDVLLRRGEGSSGRLVLEEIRIAAPGTPTGEPFLDLARLQLNVEDQPDVTVVDLQGEGIDVFWAVGGDNRSNWRRFGHIVVDANIENEPEEEAEGEEEETAGRAPSPREDDRPRERRSREPRKPILWERVDLRDSAVALARQQPMPGDALDGAWEVARLGPITMKGGRGADGGELRVEATLPGLGGEALFTTSDDAPHGEVATSGRVELRARRFPYHLLTELPEAGEESLAILRALADYAFEARWEDGAMRGELSLSFEEVRLTERARRGLLSRLREGQLFSDDDGSAWARTIEALVDPATGATAPITREFDVEMDEWNPFGAFFLVLLQLQEARVEALAQQAK